MMQLDLTNPEQGNRWAVHDLDGAPIPGVLAADTVEAWLDLVLDPGAPAVAEEFDADDADVNPRRRRRKAAQAAVPPTVGRRYQDFNVFDLLNQVVVAQARR